MKKEDLEQLVKDLMEMNKYLVKENEELKNELKRQRGVFLESIQKWDKSVERFKCIVKDCIYPPPHLL